MRHGRRLLQSLIVSLLTLMVLMNSGLFGPAPIGMASAQAIARVQAAQQAAQGDKGRFVPNTQAPTLPVGTYHYPGKPKDYGLTNSNSSSPTSSMESKRTPGEQADLRTENSTTTLNPDGTWTLKTYGQPIHYKDAQGQWQDIDTSVVADGTDAGYAYGNKANSWHVHFTKTAGGNQLVHAQWPGVNAVETLNGAAAAGATTNGSKTIYASVFAGVDLQYTVMHTHLEETLLLHDASGPASYTFTYHLPGASAHQDARGNILFTDSKGNVLLVVGGVSMYEADAQGNRQPKGRGTDNVAIALSGSGPDFTVTLTPDHAWLTDPHRAFPVAIDPSWSGPQQGGGSSGFLYGDTFDESANPDWSFWTDQAERIGNFNINPPGYNTGTNRAYIKFPVPSQPSNARVTSATLALWQTSSYAGTAQIIANAITSSWNETTLTWNNHPTGFVYGGSGNASTSYNVSINLDVKPAA